MKTLSAIVCLTLFTIIMGACALQDSVTPCFIDERVGEYTGAGMTTLVPYTTIADAKRLGKEMNFVSVEKREALLEEVKKNSRLHAFLADALSSNLIDANSLRETLFGPTGVASALTGLLGLSAGAMFIKRPGDLRKEDVEDI